MNFTREPIIETVITPREGCKLIVRSSKGVNQEDYLVEAVEVVSFGHSFFFRSTERPRSFFVPVSDYEVLELKEVRMALKNAGGERSSIKIGGGRDTPLRPQPQPVFREPEQEPLSAAEDELPFDERSSAAEQGGVASADRADKRPGRRRSRRRRGGAPEPRREAFASEETSSEPALGHPEKQETAPPLFISKLFPPPPTLIKETLSRYKPVVEKAPEVPAEDSFEKSDFNQDKAPRNDEEKFED